MKYVVAVLCLVACAIAQTGSPTSWTGVELNGGASLTTQPLTETFTVGSGGVIGDTLVITDSSSPANIIPATGSTAYGIAISTVAAGGTVEVARYGQVACFVDVGGATQGDLVIAGTANVTYCKDSGQNLSINIAIGTRIIGVFRTTAAAGSLAMVELTPTQFGLGEAVSLNGTPQGTFAALNLLPSTGLSWQLTPNGQTLAIASQVDSAVVPSKMAANTFSAGLKQSVAASATTAGLNVASGALPSIAVTGDIAVDPNGNLNWYDGTGWRLGTVADTTLTAGAPVFGNGNNHVTVGNTTGSGSVVLATTPTLVNPLISSFVNSNHDHSSVANGGGLSVNAFSNGANASSSTFLRGDGTWATPPAVVSSVFGRTGAIAAQIGDYNFSQIAGTVAVNQLPGNGSNASTTTFLRGDGTWATPPSVVSSVFGRTGAIAAQTGDYNFSQIGGTIALNQFPPVQACDMWSTAAFSGIAQYAIAYLPFDTEASNCASGMWFSSSPTQLIVQVAGWYQFGCSVVWSSGNSATATTQIRINGNTSNVFAGPSSLGMRELITPLQYYSAGAYAECGVSQVTSSSLAPVNGQYGTNFWAVQIR
jgi:hypothetical protein